jgi:Arc/MetJ family transcription regulator
MFMRTNIVIEDDLISEAILLAGVKTKKETVEIALREFVQNRKRKSLSALRGKKLIDPKYDYKKLRK